MKIAKPFPFIDIWKAHGEPKNREGTLDGPCSLWFLPCSFWVGGSDVGQMEGLFIKENELTNY